MTQMRQNSCNCWRTSTIRTFGYGLFHDGLTEVSPKRLKKLRSWFGKQRLGYKGLRKGLTEEPPTWLYILLKNDHSVQGVMKTLTDFYFLEANPGSRSWSMHNCVHDWTLAALDRTIDVTYYWYALNCVDATISGFDIDFYGRITFSRSAGHATRLVQQQFLKTITQFAAAAEFCTRALNGYEKALGPNHISTLFTVGDLGNLYYNQGKLDQAEKMFTRALTGYEKALGSDHIWTVLTVNNLELLNCDHGNSSKQVHLSGEQAL
ncbi:unnamed protein product [Penicillium olsonii]|uniref:Uncharacterized protein n=1 Tax=Penicillium olsonii TaxID=99116 RepID=A0A9W4HEJ7_PENOL|nr:unnamed protein product [Penicillium olsonii]CAG8077019.1 unnamed protein product [Penicillium olsonii]